MRRVLAAAMLASAVFAPMSAAAPRTTETSTIVDRDGDDRLEFSRGEEHELRQELGSKTPAADPASLLFFAQLTDTHIIDEESPLRVEFLDRFGGAFTSAYRPQEGLSAQVLEEMVQQVRNTTSPVTGRRLELVMTTGDNTDNTQCNETRWMIDVLDGKTFVEPDSGLDVPRQFTAEEVCLRQETPVPALPACEAPVNEDRYDGVRGGGEYYEPDSSTTPGADSEDGPGYSPERSENVAEAQRRTTVRDFPRLFEAMNEPFRATGLKLPWYGIFGNHDGLIQGNQPRNLAFEALATGCTKVEGLSRGQAEAAAAAANKELAMARVLHAMNNPDPDLTRLVPPDPRRRPLRKNEYIAEHFNTGGVPVGHGFTADNVASGTGNYTFNPKPGVRFVVLDTVAEHGLEEGNLDDEQFRWLDGLLTQADLAKELVFVFAHHSLRTMGQLPVSPFPPTGDTGGNLNPVVHLGEGPRNTNIKYPCAGPLPTGAVESVRCLLLRHKSVIAFVNGHEHANRVTAYQRREFDGPLEGGFWEINTASHIDWPQQSRVLDLLDNRDGSLSIVSTIIDHGAPPEPGGPPAPRDGQGQSAEGVKRLASISRELSFNDPHGSTGEHGSDARGGPEDRNVELVIRDPRK